MCNTKRDLSEIATQYAPLLKKYAYKLAYEDAYQDLCLLVIETLRKLDDKALMLQDTKYLPAYLQKTVFHGYIALSKKTADTAGCFTFFQL